MKKTQNFGVLACFLGLALLAQVTVRATPPEPDSTTPLAWDPGLTHEGTRIHSQTSDVATNYYFKVTTANPSLGAWRTALKVLQGEAHLYLSKGALPSTTRSDFRSERIGSDGFVLSSAQFAPNEVWYILVTATAGTRFALVSGAPYVQDLGAISADDSSGSGDVIMGPEGIRFFSAQVPTDALAWRLWLNGTTNTILLRKTGVPLASNSEFTQRGQALVVPPYLAGGQLYFIGVVGDPGTTNRLDSRQQAIFDLPYGVNTLSSNVTGYPYTTYRIRVPAQQIAWRLSIPSTNGNPNISVRRNTVPNENNNDATSELPAPLTDNIALVPPVLSDGTFYVTVWSTNVHHFTLQNGPAVVTDLNYISTTVNDDPDRVGWRYYRVSDINQQLGSLGWQLSVSNFAPGTRIAIRRNAAPGIWAFRNPNQTLTTYHDLISVAQTLQEPGHQADVWYIGVYNPTNALGGFTLQARELDPGPLLSVTETTRIERTNVVPGVWEYFRLDLPTGSGGALNGLGWDLRLEGVTGTPVLVVRRDAFPDSLSSTIGNPVNATNWPSRATWAAAGDWTGRAFPNVGTTNENARILTMPLGRPLQPGRYYVGVQSAAANPQPISFTLVSRWIGDGMEIPVRTLNVSGDRFTNTVAPREVDYFALEVPPQKRSLKVRLRTLSGEAMLIAAKDSLPNITSSANNSILNSAGKSVQKSGQEYLTLLPPRGTNVLTPGIYYLGVVGEGQSPPDSSRIGVGPSTYALEVVGELPEPSLGLLGNDLTVTGTLEGGDVAAYHFNTDPTTLGFWILLEDRVGNPVAVSRAGGNLADPGVGGGLVGAESYGTDGGENTGAVPGTTIAVSDPHPDETIMVKARQISGVSTNASYTLRVRQIVPQHLGFDGGSASLTNSDPQRGDYFYIDVPPNALGWDLRITNVTSGSPQLVVRRDFIPTALSTTTGFNPATATNWGSGEQWLATRDWTERTQSATGAGEDGRLLSMGMGRPLAPGRYYVTVLAPSGNANAMSYTLVSRGIGEGLSIPVQSLPFNGGSHTGTALPPREAAYFSVDIPENAASWKVRLRATRGETLLIATKGTLPNVLAAAALNSTNSAGRKMQKPGDEHFLLLPPAGTNVLAAGRYYLAVVSEGVLPTGPRLGTDSADFTVESVGQAPIRNLGPLGATDLVETNELAAGDTQIYQFTVPAGTLGIEARLDQRMGNPVMVLRGGSRPGQAGAGQASITPENYGNENGEGAPFDVHPSLISAGNVTNSIYTLVVMARSSGTFSNATYSLRLNASGTTTLAFDGESHTVAEQAARTWKYFRIVVPENAAGWDVRLLDVSAGLPRLVIRRESLPNTIQTSPWSSPGQATSWPTNAQWAPSTDWTRRSQSADNATVSEDGRVFACGMGRPLEPGTYYVGVYNNHATVSTSYTLVSRGIGAPFTIPIIEIPFTGSFSGTLPAREAAYFRVVVPSNAPNWKVKLTGDAGEAMMIGLRGVLPNIDMNNASGTLANGKGMQKAGNEHFILLPVTGQTNLPSSTNFFVVVSEGVNPPASSRIGSGTSSFTFASEGPAAPIVLGLLTSEDLVQHDVVEAGEVRLYQFLIPSGTLGFKVRLENRVGNPSFVLRYGERIPDPGSPIPGTDLYGNEGGYTSTEGHALLYTVPNPAPGIYTLAVKARPAAQAQSDASYTLRLQEILVPEINFSADLNTNGLSHTVSGTIDDNERVFFKFNIPATTADLPVIGWKLELTQSSGLASMRVRRDTLPADANTASLMPFTTASAIVVPPFLTNGVWYVEIRGAGSTSFQLTSRPLALERPAWTMPAPGETAPAPGVQLPLFGDSGIDTNGVALPADASTFLEQGTLHYYAVAVPTHNAGVLRAVLEAVSGNPDLYLRYGSPPTLYHSASGASGTIFDRSMLANGTEYANWVPLDSKVEARLRPGLWYIAVRAAGNANTRYRLKLSVGNIIDIPAHGPALSNQLVAGGDWRYYRFTAPTSLPGGFNLVFGEQSGDVVVHVRDTVPPGNGNTGAANELRDWTTDNKNGRVYPNYNAPGTYAIGLPVVRPGATYYFGIRAVSDSIFTIQATTNSVANAEPPTLAFYGGTAVTNLPPGGHTIYRVDVPADATRWRHAATHPAGVQFFLEQGTTPVLGNADDFRFTSGPNHSHNQYLLSAWPWVPGQSYFLTISNSTAAAQEIVVAMDGRNAATDDNDNDTLPDAWELQYFGNLTSNNASADPDRDGVNNFDEFMEGTNPVDANSFRPRLLTSAQFGTIVRDPDMPSYPLGNRITLHASPASGYAFVGWSGSASGLDNPLSITMNEHKAISALFKLAGDEFITALPLSGAVGNASASNVGMSKEPGEPFHAGNPGGKSIWWRWTAPSNGRVTFTTAGTPFNTLLAVYTGTSVSALTPIASDQNSGGTTGRSVASFQTVAGRVYSIAVDGLNAASGRIALSYTSDGTGGGETGGLPIRLAPLARLPSGQNQLRITGDRNRSYTFESSSDLATWKSLGTISTDSSGTAQFTDTSAPAPWTFYRAR